MKLTKRVTRTIFLPLGALLFISGCASLAPKYSRPASPVPAGWQGGAATGADGKVQRPLADIPWQEFFVDPQLRKVIALALNNNRDLRVAMLGIERSKAQFQIQSAGQFPTVNANAGYNHQRFAADLSPTGKQMNVDQFSVGLGVLSYELDLFGRVKSLKDQALEQYLATKEARRSVQISLVSQVASSYLTLAADRERLLLSRETLKSQQASYQLTRSRYQAGVSSALDLNQAQTSVDSARLDIARFTTLIAQDQNALNLVVGSPVPAELVPERLTGNLTALKEVPPGLSSEVLLNRPDILQAEGELKGANANIGAARAAFFPRITLVTSLGLGSDTLSGLFKGSSFAWQFAPQISLPIFDGGSNKANLKVAKVNRDILVAQYEKAIQTAFREVADSLALAATIDEQLAAQKSLTDVTGESYRLSSARYDKGVDSYLSVLFSQRLHNDAQQSLISVQLTRLNNLVTFYKVLGGGGE